MNLWFLVDVAMFGVASARDHQIATLRAGCGSTTDATVCP